MESSLFLAELFELANPGWKPIFSGVESLQMISCNPQKKFELKMFAYNFELYLQI